MGQTKQKLGPTERLPIALNRQTEVRQRWLEWREASKELDLAEAKEILLFALVKNHTPAGADQVVLSRVNLEPSGKMDACTSFIIWDLIENASQIVHHVDAHNFANYLYAQASEIVSERYGEISDPYSFFIDALYAEAQRCISGLPKSADE